MKPATTPVTSQPLFTASTPFDARKSDTLVIYCADGRFRPQTQEFLTEQLKLDRPITITVPGGVSIFMPLVGFAHKVAKVWLDAFADHTRRIVLIAHEDCAAYRAEHRILQTMVTQIAGKSVQDLQRQHLAAALHTLRAWYPNAAIEAYYAAVVDGTDETRRVAFTTV